MSMWERERTRRAMERAFEAMRLRREGLKWREVGERMGVSTVRAWVLGKRGEEIYKKRSALGLI